MNFDLKANSEEALKPVVIVGAGHAGLTLAREVRGNCKNTPITIIDHEVIKSYYKPNLSKALSLKKTPDQLVIKNAETLATDLDAKLLSQTFITDIDTEKNLISYRKPDIHTNEVKLSYQSLVLATGASTIKLPSTCNSGADILSINDLSDYESFRLNIKHKERVLIVGAGFVGCELASDLITNGYAVDIVDLGEWPLQRSIPEVMGAELKKALMEQGVRWHLGATLESITGKDQEDKIIRLSNGLMIHTDVVVSAIGLVPNTGMAKFAGLKTGRGIVVNSNSQTSQKDVYALGDCVEYHDNLLPFIAPATYAAKALAKTLTGNKTSLSLPALPVAVKISACPMIICPSRDKKGVWQVQGTGKDLEARFINKDGTMSGFALTGRCVANKSQLTSQCVPALN